MKPASFDYVRAESVEHAVQPVPSCCRQCRQWERAVLDAGSHGAEIQPPAGGDRFLEEDALEEREALDAEIKQSQSDWAAERAQHEAEARKYEEKLARDRKKGEDDFAYELARKRKLEADALADKREKAERQIEEEGGDRGLIEREGEAEIGSILAAVADCADNGHVDRREQERTRAMFQPALPHGHSLDALQGEIDHRLIDHRYRRRRTGARPQRQARKELAARRPGMAQHQREELGHRVVHEREHRRRA